MEKNDTDESDFSENEIPDLNSLKPFEFEPKTNVGDIYCINTVVALMWRKKVLNKVKRISNSEWCKCSAKAVVSRCS